MNYYTIIRSKSHLFYQRLEMVLFAKQNGIRAAAEEFATSRNTIRKRLRRFNEHGKAGLIEKYRAPKTCPHKTHPNTERQSLNLRHQADFSARRLKDEYDINASEGAIARIIRQHGLSRTRPSGRGRKPD